jgi:hypothetical protein
MEIVLGLVALVFIVILFDTMQAIVGGLMCGGVSILALKLFGMDKKE